MEIKKNMIRDFKKKYGYKYDMYNKAHNKKISKMVNENSDKYLEQYENALSNFDMGVMFIKNEY